MKPASFECVRAAGVDEATHLLARAGGTAKLVAGAQSLGPMLNLRLVQPTLLIDISGIAALTQVEEDDEAVTLGACITSSNIEDARIPQRGLEMLPVVAMRIAYRAVRNRGTIGGSVCHADPAADWVTVLCALGADCLIRSKDGSQRVPINHFITGAFETVLGTGELLEAIRIPRPSADARWGYAKLCRRSGEFATAMAAVLHDPARDQYRVAIGAMPGRPIVLEDARSIWPIPFSSGGSVLDRSATFGLFDRSGLLDPITRLQQFAILQRAFAQATAS